MHRGEENQRQGGEKSKATQLYTPLQNKKVQRCALYKSRNEFLIAIRFIHVFYLSDSVKNGRSFLTVVNSLQIMRTLILVDVHDEVMIFCAPIVDRWNIRNCGFRYDRCEVVVVTFVSLVSN